jgi:RNA recognition motif-containing protein
MSEVQSMSRLFLGNIPHAADEREIWDWIESHGFTVASVEIIKDRMNGNRRGFCFVSLVNREHVRNAIASLNGKTMRNRPITVNHALPLQPRARHPQRRRVA